MAITSANVGPTTNIQETIAPFAGSAGTVAIPTVLPGSNAATVGQPRALSPGTTGAATSCNVVMAGYAVLGASGAVNIDLTAFPGPNGVNRSMSKLRGYHIENEAAAELGVNAGVTVQGPTSNGQTFRGKFTNTGYVVMPNSYDAGGDLNIAGSTVDATHKLINLTAGSAGATVRFVFWGE